LPVPQSVLDAQPVPLPDALKSSEDIIVAIAHDALKPVTAINVMIRFFILLSFFSDFYLTPLSLHTLTSVFRTYLPQRMSINYCTTIPPPPPSCQPQTERIPEKEKRVLF
jgi:hypothetical protein